MAKPKQNQWLKLFQDFIGDLRIKSKEVVSDDPRGSPLVLWESQRRFMQEVGNGLDNGIHIFNCLKSRQLGVTTVSLAIDVFWLAMHDNMIGVLVTDTEDNKNANRALLEHYIKSFEPGYFGASFDIVTSNRNMLSFSNGSQLNFRVAGTRDKGIAWAEGVGYSLIHLTELAKYGNPEGVKSLEEGFAQTNPRRLMIKESTAHGFNSWRTQWMRGKEDIYTQRSFFIGWWSGDTNRIERSDPKYLQFGSYPPTGEERELIKAVKSQYDHVITPEQLAWIRWREAGAGSEQDLLAQNQPWTAEQAFVQSGYDFFAARTISKDIKNIHDRNAAMDTTYRYKGYRYVYGDDFFQFRMEELDPTEDDARLVELKIWDEPRPNGRYCIGFDPGYGNTMHGDAAVITVYRCYADKLIQVAEYCTRDVDIRHTAWVFFHLCAAYGNVMGNYDVQGPGRLVIIEFDHLRQLLNAEHNYAKVQSRKWEDAGANVRHYLYHRPDSMGAGYAKGFESSWRSKGELMHGMRSSYMTRELEIKSLKLLNEMSKVQVNDDVIGVPDSSDEDMKDDRVIATALAVKAWIDWIRKEMLPEGLTYEAVSKEESGETKPLARNMNTIVYRFLARKQEEADNYEEPRGEPWMVDNGLI